MKERKKWKKTHSTHYTLLKPQYGVELDAGVQKRSREE